MLRKSILVERWLFLSLKNKDEIIKELQEEVERLRQEKESLEKENKELKKILMIFINPHTPPSKQVFKKRVLQASKKLGAPLGHKGATREIPEPMPVKVTKHVIGFYDCKNCGVVAAETDLPKEGNFGKNTLAHVTLMKYDDRLPARKITTSLQRQHNMQLTNPTILNIIQRVVKAAQHIFEQIKATMRTFFNVYIDETSIKVAGKTF